MRKLVAVAFGAIVSTSTSTYAQPVPEPSSAPQPLAPLRDNTINRHLGFFLRPDLGLGYMSTSEPTGTSAGDLTISGVAGVFGFVVGGAIQENMIVGVHLYDGVIANPKVSLSSGQSATTSNTSLAMVGIGPEFTYYWMPSNIYFSGTVALTRMALTANGKDSNSNAGFGTRLALGKEWWVSDHWGLGLAGHVSFSSNQDSGGGSPPKLTTWVFGLAFSATYN
jgi:hypothetical protein